MAWRPVAYGLEAQNATKSLVAMAWMPKMLQKAW